MLFYCFYCIFDQINAALLSRIDFIKTFRNHNDCARVFSLQLQWSWTPTLLTVISSCLMIWPACDSVTRTSCFLIIWRDLTVGSVFWVQKASTQEFTAGTLRLETSQTGPLVWWQHLLRGRVIFWQRKDSGFLGTLLVNIMHSLHQSGRLLCQWRRNSRKSEFSWTMKKENCHSSILSTTHTSTRLHRSSLRKSTHGLVFAVTFVLWWSYQRTEEFI